jgi:hypothetical protein
MITDESQILYTASSDNVKTGPIPQQYIGNTVEQSIESCKGCVLLKDKTCYAQHGTVKWFGFNHILNSGKDYSLYTALKNRNPLAKYARFGTLGDSSAIPKGIFLKHFETVRISGLKILNYTHFWKTRGKHLINTALASCDKWEQTVEAADLGWRTSLWVDKLTATHGKYKGLRWFQCPFQTHAIKCNDCGLCDPENRYIAPIVVFKKH